MSLIYDGAAGLVRTLYDKRISGTPVLDARTHFPEVNRFAAGWQDFRDEALQIAADLNSVPRFHEVMPQQYDISANDARDWRMFILKAYGVTVARNVTRCPRLQAAVQSEPDVLSAMFSFLAPGKHIPPHRGPFRGVLRFYLGLSVPLTVDGRPGTVLTIDGIEHRLGDGQWLLWDDTFRHEVRNESDVVRIALLLDIRRRGMPLDMELLSRFLIRMVGAAVWLRRPT
ncbi:MAG: aspartyl/asparaginyl beta-hydroxylase domain-containing protein [Burkholderiaceae bacterium]|nr:MAG: aspartyl/asparaginyl beta-hydroxylase domain-containing protein [Burkholderiaceae bacterium]